MCSWNGRINCSIFLFIYVIFHFFYQYSFWYTGLWSLEVEIMLFKLCSLSNWGCRGKFLWFNYASDLGIHLVFVYSLNLRKTALCNYNHTPGQLLKNTSIYQICQSIHSLNFDWNKSCAEHSSMLSHQSIFHTQFLGFYICLISSVSFFSVSYVESLSFTHSLSTSSPNFCFWPVNLYIHNNSLNYVNK